MSCTLGSVFTVNGCMYVCTYVLIGVLMIDTFMIDNFQINHTNDALLLHCSVMKLLIMTCSTSVFITMNIPIYIPEPYKYSTVSALL